MHLSAFWILLQMKRVRTCKVLELKIDYINRIVNSSKNDPQGTNKLTYVNLIELFRMTDCEFAAHILLKHLNGYIG